MTATKVNPPLAYQGKPMTHEPKNIRFGELAARLANFMTVPVVLEPGDGTRYDLIITHLAGGAFVDGRLIVVRTQGAGGQMRAAAFVWADVDSYESRQGIATLADGYAWSETLFAWWFRQLSDAIAAASVTL